MESNTDWAFENKVFSKIKWPKRKRRTEKILQRKTSYFYCLLNRIRWQIQRVGHWWDIYHSDRNEKFTQHFSLKTSRDDTTGWSRNRWGRNVKISLKLWFDSVGWMCLAHDNVLRWAPGNIRFLKKVGQSTEHLNNH